MRQLGIILAPIIFVPHQPVHAQVLGKTDEVVGRFSGRKLCIFDNEIGSATDWWQGQ